MADYLTRNIHRREENMLMFILISFLFLAVVIWLIVSFCNTINPDEVAKLQYFGRLKKKKLTSSNGRFGSGLHFVPWFWGIKLVRIPQKKLPQVYKGDENKPSWEISGTQLQVRSKDWQKLGIDATFFLGLPDDDDQIDTIIASGVPINDEEELRKWIERAFSPDLFSVFGQYNYTDVMGGLKNEELSGKVNDLLQKPDSLLCRCGLFDNNPLTTNKPGTGEAYLRIEYVHVSGPVGKNLELIATLQLEAQAEKGAAIVKAEAAESIAKAKARIIGRTIELMLDEWFKGEVTRMGLNPLNKRDLQKARCALMGTGAYQEKEKELSRLRNREMSKDGGSFDQKNIDITSGGKPLEGSNIVASIIGTIAGAAAAMTSAKEDGGNSSGGGSGGSKKSGSGGKSVADQMKESREEYERQQKEKGEKK